MLLKNILLNSIKTKVPLSTKQTTFFSKSYIQYLVKSVFRYRHEPGDGWYNRSGNGVRDTNTTDSVYIFVGETASCVQKSPGVYTRSLKNSHFNIKP